MFTREMKESYLAKFTESAWALAGEHEDRLDLEKAMASNDIDVVKRVIQDMQNIMVASIPEGIAVPEVSKFVTGSGSTPDAISVVNIRIANKVNSERKFSFSIVVTGSKASDAAFDFMLSVYSALLVDTMASVNLIKVNDVVMKASEEAHLEYTIRVETSLGNEGKKIAALSDDEIVLVADEDRVFDVDELVILLDEPTEIISEEMINRVYDTVVNEFSAAQTPVLLVGMRCGSLLSYICDISKRVKPITYIKKVCNRNIFKLSGTKNCLAYYNKDGVYALIAVRDGDKEVVLTPFDVNTLVKVDVDVLAEVG